MGFVKISKWNALSKFTGHSRHQARFISCANLSLPVCGQFLSVIAGQQMGNGVQT
jgi:hypothetical protein